MGFVGDGVSNMLRRKSAVGALLKKNFADLIIWHFCNHRLQFAVSDILKEVQVLNYFQFLFLKKYANFISMKYEKFKKCTESLE